MHKDNDLNNPPIARVEVYPATLIALVMVVDPSTITASINANEDTVYSYDFGVFTRKLSGQSQAEIYAEIYANQEVWIDAARKQTKKSISENVRWIRQLLLADTDYLMTLDYPISDDDRRTAMAYRQALRDISKQAEYPYVVEWPTYPTIKAGGDSVYDIINHPITAGGDA